MAGPNRSETVRFRTEVGDLGRTALAFRDGVQAAKLPAVDRAIAEIYFEEPEQESGPFSQFEGGSDADYEDLAIAKRGATYAVLGLELSQDGDGVVGAMTRHWKGGLNGNTEKLSKALFEGATSNMKDRDPTLERL